MESKHWAEMLLPVARGLAAEQRFDDLANLLTLARESRLRHALQAQLAIGLMQVGQTIKSFDAIEDTDMEHMMIFLGDSCEAFEKIEPGLGLRVLNKATQVAGWMRQDWLGIHEMITIPVGETA
jgi:hypothetical protein